MAKAFSEQEKEQIRQRLLEEGVRLFHENGNRALSIRELTARAGIAPGSFYHFFADKQALILEIAEYRSRQKTEAVLEQLRSETADPAGLLAGLLNAFFLDMAQKVQEKQMYRDMMRLILQSGCAVQAEDFCYEYLRQAADILAQKEPPMTLDMDGMRSLLAAVALLMEHQSQFSQPYGQQLISLMLTGGVRSYVKEEKEHEEHE